MLTPKIPPSYLTTNQSEECPQADQARCGPLPHLAFKKLSLKAISGFRSFEHELLVLLAWPQVGCLAINAVLSFTTTWCQ